MSHTLEFGTAQPEYLRIHPGTFVLKTILRSEHQRFARIKTPIFIGNLSRNQGCLKQLLLSLICGTLEGSLYLPKRQDGRFSSVVWISHPKRMDSTIVFEQLRSPSIGQIEPLSQVKLRQIMRKCLGVG